MLDLLFVISYLAYIPTSFIQEHNQYGLIVLQSMIVFSTIVKVSGYLRIFDEFGFLVQMITSAITDSFQFIVYFLMILASFSIQMSFLTVSPSTDILDHSYDNSQILYMIATIRNVLGDPRLPELDSQYDVLFWIVWLLLAFIGQIILMNFIIAVVADSYRKCMDTRTEQMIKVRLEMVVERESLMTEQELANEEWFPRFVLFGKDPKDVKGQDILAMLQTQLCELKHEQNDNNLEVKKRMEELDAKA